MEQVENRSKSTTRAELCSKMSFRHLRITLVTKIEGIKIEKIHIFKKVFKKYEDV